MLTLKLIGQASTRRRSVDPAAFSFDALLAVVAASFPGESVARIAYVDDEGDTVTIKNNDDLAEAMRLHRTP